jgi:hypothetical protein
MRRAISVILFIIGGWLLMGEPLIAFMRFGDEPSLGARAIAALVCLGMAAVPLAIGSWVSPGNRRRELGLTILIAVGAAVFCGLAVAAVFLDPGFKPFMPAMPPMPDLRMAPVAGTVNLLVLAGIGLLLYRGWKRQV